MKAALLVNRVGLDVALNLRVGYTALMTNYVAERDLMGGSFGGAAVESGDGTVIAQHPLGVTGILFADL